MASACARASTSCEKRCRYVAQANCTSNINCEYAGTSCAEMVLDIARPTMQPTPRGRHTTITIHSIKFTQNIRIGFAQHMG